MNKSRSLAINSAKKRKILIGCAIGGTALIMAGAGIGIGYVIKKSAKQDTISFNDDLKPSLTVTDTTPISATSSAGHTVDLSASGEGEGIH
ncbi:hypothetical protein FACS1894166_13160 [Bacilli bacterium]|nr:hypothetical protein FACS1894166_13160 [Bacilli bacterium]